MNSFWKAFSRIFFSIRSSSSYFSLYLKNISFLSLKSFMDISYSNCRVDFVLQRRKAKLGYNSTFFQAIFSLIELCIVFFADLSKSTSTNVMSLDIIIFQLTSGLSVFQTFVKHSFLLETFWPIRVKLTLSRVYFLNDIKLTMALE